MILQSFFLFLLESAARGKTKKIAAEQYSKALRFQSERVWNFFLLLWRCWKQIKTEIVARKGIANWLTSLDSAFHSFQYVKTHWIESVKRDFSLHLVLIIVTNHLFGCLPKRFKSALLNGELTSDANASKTLEYTRKHVEAELQKIKMKKSLKHTYFNLFLRSQEKRVWWKIGKREKWIF